jgi:hypothetical protein
MSGYASKAEVHEVIIGTLRTEGRDPRDYNVSGIARDAFHYRGANYGYGANTEKSWRMAVDNHKRKGTRP